MENIKSGGVELCVLIVCQHDAVNVHYTKLAERLTKSNSYYIHTSTCWVSQHALTKPIL